MRTETVTLDVPVVVKCRRRRHRKPDSYVLLRPVPVQVASYDADEAPALLSLKRHDERHVDLVPRGTERAHALSDGGWSSPLHVPSKVTGGLADAAGLVKEMRDGGAWADCPYDACQRHLDQRRVEVHHEGQFAVEEWVADPGPATRSAAEALSSRLCLVDGTFHRRRPSPRLAVRVKPADYHSTRGPPVPRTLGDVGITAALADPRGDGILATQTFPPERIDAAIEYANRLRHLVGCRPALHSYWDREAGHADTPDPLGEFLADLAARFPDEAAGSVGGLPRADVEDYLDLRDLAAGGPDRAGDFADAFLAFFLRVRTSDLTCARALSFSMQFEVVRLEVERGDSVFRDRAGGERLSLAVPHHAGVATRDEEALLAAIA